MSRIFIINKYYMFFLIKTFFIQKKTPSSPGKQLLYGRTLYNKIRRQQIIYAADIWNMHCIDKVMGILFLVNYRKVYATIFLWLDLSNCTRGEDFVRQVIEILVADTYITTSNNTYQTYILPSWRISIQDRVSAWKAQFKISRGNIR